MQLSAPPARLGLKTRLIPGLSLRSGDVLAGRYRILSIGNAGAACAHLVAVDVTRNAPVTIQLLVASEDGSETAGVAFLAGARREASLKTRRVSRVLDAGVTPDGWPYAVREALPPQTLASALEQHRAIATASAVDVAIAICEALAEAHVRGIVHGELNPSSIRLLPAARGLGEPRLADLGTASAIATLARATRRGEVPRLRAPEQAAGQRADARSDVWAVGALLYTMLAGEPPFQAETPSSMDVALASEDPPCLAGIPDELAEIVEACLDRDPKKRPTMAHLATKLAPFGSVGAPMESTPTMVVRESAYEALTREKDVPPKPQAAPQRAAMSAGALPATSRVGAADAMPAAMRALPSTIVEPSPPPAGAVFAPTVRPARRDGGKLRSQVDARPAISAAALQRRYAILGVLSGFVVVAIFISIARHTKHPNVAESAVVAEPAKAAVHDAQLTSGTVAIGIQPTVVQPAAVQPAAEPTEHALTPDDLPTVEIAAPVAYARPRGRFVSAPPRSWKTSTPAAAAAGPAPVAVAPAAAPAAAAPSPAAAPPHATPTEHKTSDEDLRRFLDDRR